MATSVVETRRIHTFVHLNVFIGFDVISNCSVHNYGSFKKNGNFVPLNGNSLNQTLNWRTRNVLLWPTLSFTVFTWNGNAICTCNLGNVQITGPVLEIIQYRSTRAQSWATGWTSKISRFYSRWRQFITCSKRPCRLWDPTSHLPPTPLAYI